MEKIINNEISKYVCSDFHDNCLELFLSNTLF